MSRNHFRYLARTVFVKNNDIDTSSKILDRILQKEKIFDSYRKKQFYEKPFQTRQRLSYERCKRIYDTDMSKKVRFIMRTHRENPFPR